MHYNDQNSEYKLIQQFWGRFRYLFSNSKLDKVADVAIKVSVEVKGEWYLVVTFKYRFKMSPAEGNFGEIENLLRKNRKFMSSRLRIMEIRKKSIAATRISGRRSGNGGEVRRRRGTESINRMWQIDDMQFETADLAGYSIFAYSKWQNYGRKITYIARNRWGRMGTSLL